MAVVSVLVLVLHGEIFFFGCNAVRSVATKSMDSDSDTAAVTVAAVTIAAVTIAAVTMASTSMNPVLRFD